MSSKDTQFKPGNKLGGRKPLSKDILKAKSESLETFLKWVIEVMGMNLDEFGNTKSDIARKINEMPLGQRAVAKWFLDTDPRGVQYCQNRLWGKIKEEIDLDLSKILDNVEIKINPVKPEKE